MNGYLTEEEFYNKVADNVKRIREEFGDTQLFLEKGLKLRGNFVCQVETRRASPSLYTAYKILVFYGVDFNELIK